MLDVLAYGGICNWNMVKYARIWWEMVGYGGMCWDVMGCAGTWWDMGGLFTW